jgi:hypothetical protein
VSDEERTSSAPQPDSADTLPESSAPTGRAESSDDSFDAHLSESFKSWAEPATRNPAPSPSAEPVLLTHYRLEYDTAPTPLDDAEITVSPISKREIRRASRRAAKRATHTSQPAAADRSAEDALATWHTPTPADSIAPGTVSTGEDDHLFEDSDARASAAALAETSAPSADPASGLSPDAQSYDDWVTEGFDEPSDNDLDRPSAELTATSSVKRRTKRGSNVLMLLACCLVTFGLVVLRSGGGTPPPPPPPPPSSSIPPLTLSGAGWQVPESSLTLQSFMPSVAALRTQVSSTLEISAEGPLPLDQSVDSASAALYPGVLAGFSRSFANPSEKSALTLTALSYTSSSAAESAVRALADMLGTTSLTYRAPSPPGISFPQGDDLVVATRTENGEGDSTVVLRREQVLFIATSRVSLASALAAVAASNAQVAQSVSARDSSIGALRPWTPSGTLDVSHPPLSASEPPMNLHYPILGTSLCLGRDDLGMWSKMSCNFRTNLPFETQSSVLSATSVPDSSVPQASSSSLPVSVPSP